MAQSLADPGKAGPITEPFGSLNAQSWRIPVTADDTGKTILLDATTYLPMGIGPFPLVIINHGAALDAPSNGAWDYRPEAAIRWFLSKGYAVAILIRRGYGRSQGERVKLGDCAEPEYIGGGNMIARDITGAVDYLRGQPFVLPDRILLVGHSLGGAGSLAAASKNPQGVLSVIAFAPGAGNIGPHLNCRIDMLEDALKTFGATNKLPTLWIYAENDSYFGPELGNELFKAYIGKSDATREIRILPPGGEDGHELFLRDDGPATWGPVVESFLQKIDQVSP